MSRDYPINIKTGFSFTKTDLILHSRKAVEENNIVELHRLLSSNMPANITDMQGLTALHFAAQNKNSRILALLIRYNANPNAKAFTPKNPQTIPIDYIDDATSLEHAILTASNIESSHEDFKKALETLVRPGTRRSYINNIMRQVINTYVQIKSRDESTNPSELTSANKLLTYILTSTDERPAVIELSENELACHNKDSLGLIFSAFKKKYPGVSIRISTAAEAEATVRHGTGFSLIGTLCAATLGAPPRMPRAPRGTSAGAGRGAAKEEPGATPTPAP